MAVFEPRKAFQRVLTDDIDEQTGVEMRNMDGKHDKKDASVSVEIAEFGSKNQARANTTLSELSQHVLAVKRRFSGWRMGSIAAASTAFVSLILNIAAVAYLNAHQDRNTGLVELYNGDCTKTAALTTWVHLVINALSTILLGGSNYCMQCLSAPNREAIDDAHAKGKSLDIGVPSFRNLKSIGWFRLSMWLALGVSSIPLHLLYNSAFYSSLASNDYYVYVAAPSFLTGGNATIADPIENDYHGQRTTAVEIQQQVMSNDTNIFDQLDPLTCMKEYGDIFLQKRRNLVIMSRNTSTDDSAVLHALYYSFEASSTPEHGLYQPYGW